MVFRTFALFPWLTVLDNVEAGLEALGRPRTSAAGVHWRQSILSDSTVLRTPIRANSRAACASASDSPVPWSSTRPCLLMDEPFSALDVLTAETLRTDLLDLWTGGRLPIKSILIVTHNIEEAVFMCDRILVLSTNPPGSPRHHARARRQQGRYRKAVAHKPGSILRSLS